MGQTVGSLLDAHTRIIKEPGLKKGCSVVVLGFHGPPFHYCSNDMYLSFVKLAWNGITVLRPGTKLGY
jgi:hypothetical protein